MSNFKIVWLNAKMSMIPTLGYDNFKPISQHGIKFNIPKDAKMAGL